MKNCSSPDRRSFLKLLGTAGLVAPFISRHALAAPPSRVLRHASFGTANMALADIKAICFNEFVQLVAVADVDLNQAAEVKARFPEARIYQDWRELLDKEHKNLDSVNVSTPDHTHAPMALAAMQLGKHVYCQKPLTHSLHETRVLTEYARQHRLVTQMGIQVHSHKFYRQGVALIQSGAIGQVKEVHLWCSKKWGDLGAPPAPTATPPAGFNWDLWLAGCADRPYVGNNYYHTLNWRKRLDFGTGTFGDMGCHIYDPVFEALELTAPISVRSEGPAPDRWNWAVNAKIRYVFPGTRYTEGKTVALTWYDGDQLPPADIRALVPVEQDANAKKKRQGGFPSSGSIVIGTKGVMLLPHYATPRLFPVAQFKDFALPPVVSADHWTQWAKACTGEGKTTTNFDYSGPLTEAVLLGSVAVRFPQTTLEWNSGKLAFDNVKEANAFVRRTYRKGWEVTGL
ncbi:MAG: Gfo/Idh/MocA family oxidoreductase [Opitutae bacterium]|nr:Gfo/Idh/MocA family oxidoreductase [Opitutae bacterium]